MKSKGRSRWTREQQRRAGTHQMWQLISCCGRWDPSFLEKDGATTAGVTQPGGVTKEQKQKTTEAVQARGKVRLAQRFERMSHTTKLELWQQDMVTHLHDGSLISKANRLTMESGHGRLRCRGGTFVDIGGSTGGHTRTVLFDWTPPKLTELDIL